MKSKLNNKQKQVLQSLKQIPKVGSKVKESEVINKLLEFHRASGNPTGQRIKSRRHALNLSQAQLAHQMGWSRTRMSKVERAYQACSSQDFVQLGKILKVTPLWLMIGDEIPKAIKLI